jgi:hypothetical protein
VVEFESIDGLVYYYLESATDIEMAGEENIQWSEVEPTEVHDHIVIPEGEWYLYSMAVDDAGNQGYGEPQYFKVDLTSPALAWELAPDVPDGDGQWYCSSLTIRVNAIDQSENVMIFWSIDHYYEWTEYDNEVGIILPNGEHVVRLQGIDLAGNIYMTKTELIKVDTKLPEVFITSPVADETCGRSITVSWHGLDVHSGLKCYKVRLDQKVWEDMFNDTSFEFEDLNHGTHRITVRAWDLAGNYIQVRQTFSVDAEGAKINSRLPVGQNVPVNSKIVLEFSEQMDTDNVEMSIAGLSGTLFWENSTAIYILNQDMEYSTKYTIRVTGCDQYGNDMYPYEWMFETAPEPVGEVEDSKFVNSLMFMGIMLTIALIGVLIGLIIIIKIYLYKKKK